MTIHTTHPFADAEPDPVRRLRGRVGATVSLWTAGEGRGRAGLTVSSWMVAAGEPGRVLGLVDPESELAEAVRDSGRAVVSLLAWRDRDLADAFAGVAPAPGGPFTLAAFEATAWGPRPRHAVTWAGVELESVAEVGWSLLLTTRVVTLDVGDDVDPLVHRRGRYRRSGAVDGGA